MFAVVLAVFFLVLMSIWTLFQVRHDFEKEKALRPETVASVLGVYTFHFAIELVAAWARFWPYSTYQLASMVLGAVLGGAGIIFLGLGIAHLGNFNDMAGLETGELVTSGIYRWSRHPQNLGWSLVLVGIGLVSRSLLALMLAVVFWGIFVAYVPMEEDYLESIYGEKYREYRENTWRYFGPPGKMPPSDWFGRRG